jgi:hypothetical protein
MPNYNYKELGYSGLRRQSGYIHEDFLPELRWPRAYKIYQEMADNDPVIGAILYLAEMLIRGVTWDVEPAGKTDADKEAAEFLKSCMDDMESSWGNTITEILSMLTFGFSFHEIVYKVRRGPMESDKRFRSKFKDGRIGWRKLPIRAQSSLAEWVFSDTGELVAFVQCSEPSFITATIPMTKGLLFRTKVGKDNPEGKSLLRNAYRPWYFKKHFEEIEGIGIERDLAGFPVLKAPAELDLWNPDDERMVALKANAEKLVQNIRRDSEEGALLPYGWELSLLSTNSSRQIDIGGTIDRYDNRIAITLLSDIVLIGGTKSGSFALADTKQSLLTAALESQLISIADVFNDNAVATLFKINNFPGIEQYPKIKPGKLISPTFTEISLMLRSMGLPISRDKELQNHLRKLLGVPLLTDEVYDDIYDVPVETPGVPGAMAPTAGTKPARKDTLDSKAEQNDTKYTGGKT